MFGGFLVGVVLCRRRGDLAGIFGGGHADKRFEVFDQVGLVEVAEFDGEL